MSSATRPPSTTATRSQRSASSARCVVSSTVSPRCARSELDALPRVAKEALVEAGGRLVHHQQRRLVQQRARQLEPALHAAREVDHRVVGALAQRGELAAAPRALARPARGRPYSAGAEQQVLARGQARSRLGAWNTTPMRRRSARPPGSTTLRRRATPRPRPARASPVSTRSVVDLPLPFGPSRPKISPGRTRTTGRRARAASPKPWRSPRISSRGCNAAAIARTALRPRDPADGAAPAVCPDASGSSQAPLSSSSASSSSGKYSKRHEEHAPAPAVDRLVARASARAAWRRDTPRRAATPARRTAYRPARTRPARG